MHAQWHMKYGSIRALDAATISAGQTSTMLSLTDDLSTSLYIFINIYISFACIFWSKIQSKQSKKTLNEGICIITITININLLQRLIYYNKSRLWQNRMTHHHTYNVVHNKLATVVSTTKTEQNCLYWNDKWRYIHHKVLQMWRWLNSNYIK